MAAREPDVPEGFHTVTPHLVIKGASEAIEFYKKAFGAVEMARMPGPNGGLMHAMIMIGDSAIYLADESPQWGNLGPQGGKSPVTFHLFVPNCDAAFAQAVEAGATPAMPPADMFWGDRYSKVVDPFGHHWSLAQRIEDLSLEEMKVRGDEFMKKMGS